MILGMFSELEAHRDPQEWVANFLTELFNGGVGVGKLVCIK